MYHNFPIVPPVEYIGQRQSWVQTQASKVQPFPIPPALWKLTFLQGMLGGDHSLVFVQSLDVPRTDLKEQR